MPTITLPDASVKLVLSDGRIDPSWYRALAQVVAAVTALNAAQIPYDNATSALTATDVQAAIDEIEARVEALEP